MSFLTSRYKKIFFRLTSPYYFWILVGNIAGVFTQWSIFIVVSRLGTLQELGEFSLAFAITSPLFIAAGLGLNTLQQTNFKTRFSDSDYFSLRVICSAVSLLLCLVFLISFSFSSSFKAIIILVGVLKALDLISEIINSAYLSAFLSKQNATLQICKSFIIISCLLLSLKLGFALWSSLFILIILRAVFLRYLEITRLRLLEHSKLIQNEDKEAIKCVRFQVSKNLWVLFKNSWFLGFVGLLISLQSNIPLYMLGVFYEYKFVSAFTLLSHLSIPLVTIANSYSSGILNELYQHLQQQRPKLFVKVIGNMIGYGLFVTAVFCSFYLILGSRILELIYGSPIVNYQDFIPLYCINIFFLIQVNILGFIIATMRFSKSLLLFYLFLVLSITTSSYYLVPAWGISGAIYSQIINYFLYIVLGYFLVYSRAKKIFVSQK